MKKPCIEVKAHFKLYRLHPSDITKLSKIVMPSTPPLPAWTQGSGCSPHQKEDFIATIDQEEDAGHLNLANS